MSKFNFLIIAILFFMVSCDFNTVVNKVSGIVGEENMQSSSSALSPDSEKYIEFFGKAPYDNFKIDVKNQSLTEMFRQVQDGLSKIHGSGNVREAFTLTQKYKTFFIVKNREGFNRLIFVDYANRIIKDVDESLNVGEMSRYQVFDYCKIFNNGKQLIIVGHNKSCGPSSMAVIVLKYEVDSDSIEEIVLCRNASVEESKIIAKMSDGTTEDVTYSLKTNGEQLIIEKESAILPGADNIAKAIEQIINCGSPTYWGRNETQYFMTPEYYKAIKEAYEVPSDGFGDMGSSDMELEQIIDVVGNGGADILQVKIEKLLNDKELCVAKILTKVVWDESRLSTGQGVVVEIVDEFEGSADIMKHTIELVYSDAYGRWVVSDFDGSLTKFTDYTRKMRNYYRSDEWKVACEDAMRFVEPSVVRRSIKDVNIYLKQIGD